MRFALCLIAIYRPGTVTELTLCPDQTAVSVELRYHIIGSGMPKFTLLYVHGTGVRLQGQSVTLDEIQSKVNEFELPCDLKDCMWGDALGIDFEGRSLPGPVPLDPDQEALTFRWQYLQADPLVFLKLWCTPAAGTRVVLGQTPAKSAWNKSISVYRPTLELTALLDRGHVTAFFEPAWKTVVESDIPEEAFTGAGNEDASVARVFAEAVVAQMTVDAGAAAPIVAIPHNLRSKIVDRLLYDWKQMGKGLLKDALARYLGRRTRDMVRPRRAQVSETLAAVVGDILRYQAVGEEIRNLIREKIDRIPGDVFVLSHSLGGVACFELMVERTPPNVKGLITVGSQAPLFYEFDALQTLGPDEELPATFPRRWLNIYDENDLLSYCANRVFGREVDHKVDSVLPPLEAHSAYWKQDDTWKAIRDFIAKS
jgi:hypothetical protein